MNFCEHVKEIADVTPSADGCEDCLKIGGRWMHLRLCESCGHVGCCDNSPNRHATKHYDSSKHPIVKSPGGRGLGLLLKRVSLFKILPANNANVRECFKKI